MFTFPMKKIKKQNLYIFNYNIISGFTQNRFFINFKIINIIQYYPAPDEHKRRSRLAGHFTYMCLEQISK